MIAVPEVKLQLDQKVHLGNRECLKSLCDLLKATRNEDLMNYFLSHVVHNYFRRM